MFKNTLVITVLALAGMLAFAAMVSYVLARRRAKFNAVMFFLLLSGMMAPFQMSIMTQYKLVRALGLMNNIFSVVLIDIAVNLPLDEHVPHDAAGDFLPIDAEAHHQGDRHGRRGGIKGESR